MVRMFAKVDNNKLIIAIVCGNDRARVTAGGEDADESREKARAQCRRNCHGEGRILKTIYVHSRFYS